MLTLLKLWVCQFICLDNYIFLCDTNINIENMVKYLYDIFSINNYKMRTINRGVIPVTT